MKAALIILIFGALFALCFGQAQEVGPTPCGAIVPNVQTDDFITIDQWESEGKNFTQWEQRFHWYRSSAEYTVYDILVKAEPLDATNTELADLWELVPVDGHAGYYRFPEWRRTWGVSGGQIHTFGYITKGSPFPLMYTFEILKFTCSSGYEIEF